MVDVGDYSSLKSNQRRLFDTTEKINIVYVEVAPRCGEIIPHFTSPELNFRMDEISKETPVNATINEITSIIVTPSLGFR